MATITLTPASTSPLVLPNVSVLTSVLIWGAGGNGGAGSSTTGGGGGGSGGCRRETDVAAGPTIDFLIATGGSGLTGSIGSITVGSGGNATDYNRGEPGAGGGGSGIPGLRGGLGSDGGGLKSGGGGAGASGPTTAGNEGVSYSGSSGGAGGIGSEGGGNGGRGGDDNVTDYDGVNGSAPGGGGGGAGNDGSNPGPPGLGADGLGVVVYYADPAPDDCSPAVGSIDGGTAVTITGVGFSEATGVTFGGVAATDFVLVDDTEITCTTPAHAAGAVDVVVSNAEHDGTLTDGFTYYEPPQVDSVSPAFDDVNGGASVTITGTGFTGATSATLRGVAITSFTVVNDTTITGVAGASMNAGSGDVEVFNPVFNGSLEDEWTYYPVPAPTSVAPSYGVTAGGTSVTITGSGFWGATSVEFDGDAATNFAVVDDEHITCDTPAHAAATVDVEVINPATSGTLNSGYEYSDTPPETTTTMYRGFAMICDVFKAYQQLTSLSGVNTFSSLVTVPTGAIGMVMTAEAQAIRWTGDGTDPSASVGNLLPAGYSIDIRRSTSSSNPFAQIRAIEVTSGAKVSLQFYA